QSPPCPGAGKWLPPLSEELTPAPAMVRSVLGKLIAGATLLAARRGGPMPLMARSRRQFHRGVLPAEEERKRRWEGDLGAGPCRRAGTSQLATWHLRVLSAGRRVEGVAHRPSAPTRACAAKECHALIARTGPLGAGSSPRDLRGHLSVLWGSLALRGRATPGHPAQAAGEAPARVRRLAT